MFLSVLSVFLAFALGGALCLPIALRWKPGRLVHALGALAALTLYYLLVFLLPFRGALTEVLVLLAAGLAWAGPLAALHLLGRQRPARLGLVVGFGLVFPLVAGVMMTLLSRVNHALWLDWAFDGTVTAKSRNAANHGVPVVTIDGVSYEAVDEQFWVRAQVGQHATKQAGSSWATLEGTPVRMLQRDLGWDE